VEAFVEGGERRRRAGGRGLRAAGVRDPAPVAPALQHDEAPKPFVDDEGTPDADQAQAQPADLPRAATASSPMRLAISVSTMPVGMCSDCSAKMGQDRRSRPGPEGEVGVTPVTEFAR